MISQDDIDAFEQEHETIVQDTLKAQNTINPDNTANIAAALVGEIQHVENQEQAVRNLQRAIEIEHEEINARAMRLQQDITELTHLREAVDDQADEIADLSERLRYATESNRELVDQLAEVGKQAADDVWDTYRRGWEDRERFVDRERREFEAKSRSRLIMGSVSGSIMTMFTLSLINWLAG